MSDNRFHIRLKEASDEPVSLESMSHEALETFIEVMTALKELAESSIPKERLNFIIEEGSASAACEAPPADLISLYNNVESAINGNCDDPKITSPLRTIQLGLNNERLDLEFDYLLNGSRQNLRSRIRGARKIQKKRRPKRIYTWHLVLRIGKLNEIGGTEPNYHFSEGGGIKTRVWCSEDQAKSITDFLYKEFHVVVLKKEFHEEETKDEYFHHLVIEREFAESIQTFLTNYRAQLTRVKRLGVIYDFVDELLAGDKERAFKLIAILVQVFNNKNLHLSELKTVLIVSRPFMHNELISSFRASLLQTFNEKKGE